MPLVIADRVRETTTSTGTGTITLGGAYSGFQTFSVIGNGNSTYYAIIDSTAGAWEVGIGTYTSSGNTLSRTTVLDSSNAGSLVNFAAGTKDVICTQPADRAVTVQEGGTGLYAGVAAFTSGAIPYADSTTTLANLAIGASGRYLSSSGTAPQWSAPAALTKVDDTNVTLTLGGSPTTALLNAASLTLGWSGQLSLGRGGTNANLTASAGSVAYSTASAIAFTAVGTSNQVLISNGASAPSWANLSSLGVTSFSAGTTGFTPSTGTTGAVTLAGTLATTNGGTGLTSFSANQIFFASSTSAIGQSANLTWNGSTLAVTGAVTATTDSSFTSTGALTISKGTTAQQPGSPTTGMIRYNTTTNQFEGYSGSSPAWKSIGGSALSNDTATSTNVYPVFATATTGTAENLYTSNAKLLYKPSTGELQSTALVASNGIVVNSATVSTSYSIPSGSNGMSAGPVTVASGITVTVPSGSVWAIV